MGKMVLITMCALLLLGSGSTKPQFVTSDVTRFYAIYRASDGHPTAYELQRDYIDVGSAGLHRLARERRHITGAAIAAEIVKYPAMYGNAEKCTPYLPRVGERLQTVFANFRSIYPEAKFLPITIVISHGKPAGIADKDGVIIGLDPTCYTKWGNPNLEDLLVHEITHEMVHVQQALAVPAYYNDARPTVLQDALIEGSAEFITELTSGEAAEVAYANFARRTRGHEVEIEQAFLADQNDTGLSQWLDNSTLATPGDLGYWVGYRIVKSYYEHASDKRLAVRNIIRMNDPKAFLAASGWYPGIHIVIPR